ncbi:unnamed protein product [Rodentolepis nana]|uniref:Tumor protein p53-inducible nuclear protein 1 n=1 Tax=Rodentolepis nana TaxID=102285 RepID=A0A0R3T9V2_RODNA|nr:unnamed protein product [Rodentolepis nana]
MDKWQLIHSDGEFVDVDDDTSSISSDWSVMNFQDIDEVEGNRAVEDPQPSSSEATTPTSAESHPPPPPSAFPPALSSHCTRHGRRRGRATTTRHNEAFTSTNRAVSLTVRHALAPSVTETKSSALVSAKVSNQAALLAKMQHERRQLRRGGGNNTPRAQLDRKHAKWMHGQGRIGHAFQRSKVRDA